MCKRAVPGAVLCFLVALAAAQEISPDTRQQITRWVTIQRNWGVRGSSEGARLTAKEVARTETGGKPVVAYDFYVQGLPRNQEYELGTLPITAKGPEDLTVNHEDHLRIEADGRLVDSPGDPRRNFLFDPAPGEPFRFALLSKDGKRYALVSVVPNPIEGRDQRCAVQILRLTPKFELAYVEGSGFAPDSEVAFSADSLGEVQTGKLKVDSGGDIQTAILPFVKDKPQGTTEISLSSEDCKPRVKFHWGTIP